MDAPLIRRRGLSGVLNIPKCRRDHIELRDADTVHFGRFFF